MSSVSTKDVPSYDHGAASTPLVGRMLGEQFHLVAGKAGDREALVDCASRLRLTYGELKGAVDKLAAGLIHMGIEPGERVGIWSTNNVEWVITQLATAQIGAILVNINPAYRQAELEYALKQSGVRLLVLIAGYKGDEYLSMVRALAPDLFSSGEPGGRLPELRHLVLAGGVPQGYEKVRHFDSVTRQGTRLIAEGLPARAAGLDFDGPINIQYTSGTTGFPKGVTLSHHNLLNNARACAEAMGLDENARFCVPMPFYHCGGMVLCTLATLFVGGTLVIPSPSFDAGKVLEAVETEGCTHLSGVPTMYITELEHPRFGEFNLTTLRGGFMAGAPCPVELMRQVASRMHLKEIVIFYGQTECSPVITATTVNDTMERRATTVGKVIPHLEVKISDPLTSRVVPRGVQGEICARGYAVMSGYWNDPQATAQAVDAAGWLHTGDLGTMDDAGYVNVTGRKKEMIIRAGENIYPREIEEVVHMHEAVAQAHIFGVPDDHFGEEVAMWLTFRTGASCEVEELRAWLKERISHFKVPKYIKVVDDFPMTVTGKVQKFVMRARMVEELGLSSAADIRTA